MNKRGISALVATVLLIVITVAAIGIVWQIVIPLIKTSTETREKCQSAFLEVSKSFYNDSLKEASILVSRGAPVMGTETDVVLTAIQIKITSDTGDSKTVMINASQTALPKINEDKLYVINLGDLTGSSFKVEVAPVVEVNNKKELCSMGVERSLVVSEAIDLDLVDYWISDCAVLNETGGTYALAANISNSATSNCIDITANNIILDCRDNIIDGDDEADYGIYINRTSEQTTNVTIRNCRLIDWDNNIYLRYADSNTLVNIISTSAGGIYDGLTLFRSDSNTFINITANSNGDGISLTDSHSNTFTNVIANSNGYLRTGIYLYYSDSNTFTNVIANSNYYGIYLDGSSESNTLTNITANSNYDGIRLYNADSNTIKESEFFNNTNAGIFFHLSASRSNIIYNNLFNNTLNLNYSNIGNNSLNTTKQTGDRIISDGTEIGGNYWAKPTVDGYSETCADSDTDGFCDAAYTLAVDNIDYLPLSDEYIP